MGGSDMPPIFFMENIEIKGEFTSEQLAHMGEQYNLIATKQSTLSAKKRERLIALVHKLISDGKMSFVNQP